MSIRQLAESDLGLILEDEATGFGWPITVTDPSGPFDLLRVSRTISRRLSTQTPGKP